MFVIHLMDYLISKQILDNVMKIEVGEFIAVVGPPPFSHLPITLKVPGRFAPKQFPPLVVSPPRRFGDGNGLGAKRSVTTLKGCSDAILILFLSLVAVATPVAQSVA